MTSAETIKNNYFNSGVFNRDKITTIYDRVDTKSSNISTDKNHIRKKYDIPDSFPVIISIARYNPVKGHKYLIKALANIKHLGTRFKCLMVGYEDNSYKCKKKKLEELCSKLNFQNEIIFIDSKINVLELLSIANLFVLSSVGSEGSSRATLEAMVMAKPVIATKVGILPEIVINNTTQDTLSPPGMLMASHRQ